MRKRSSLTALLVAGLAWPIGAQGAQLTLGESSSGQYGFSPGGGAGLVDIAAAAPILGTGFFPPDSPGAWQLGALPATTAGPMFDGAFPSLALQSFAYSAPDGDSLSGQIAWYTLKDGSAFPDLIGTLTYAASGDADWLANWGSAGTASVDLTMDLAGGAPTLDAIATTQQGTAAANVSAGEVQPGGPIPETGSLQLLATALFCMGGLTWFRRRPR